MSVRRLAVMVPAVLVVLVGAALFASAPALALVRHEYLTQLTGFQSPASLAIDSDSNLYVVDEGSKTVDRFDSAHAPLPFSASEPYIENGELTGTPTGPGGSVVLFEDPTSVAVDDSTGHVYVFDLGVQIIDVFSSTGEYLSQLTPGHPYGGYSGRLTIDQATGNLYLYAERSLQVFSSSGEHVSTVSGVSAREGFGEGDGALFGDVAIDESTENVYLALHDYGDVGFYAAIQILGGAEVSSGSNETLARPEMIGSETPTGSLGISGQGITPVEIGLDQANGHLYVVDPIDKTVDEVVDSPSEVYEGQLTGTPSGPFVGPRAVAIDPSNGDVYVADANGAVDIFGPDISTPPAIEGESFSAATADSIKLRAHLITGRVATSYHFEYGTTSGYGSSTQSLTSKGTHYVSAELGGLLPNTEYHVRLIAENENGPSAGSDIIFRTLPRASKVSPTTAFMKW